jgi:hypothetical protein
MRQQLSAGQCSSEQVDALIKQYEQAANWSTYLE